MKMKNRTELYRLSKKYFPSNIKLSIKYSLQCLEDGTLWFKTVISWWQENFKKLSDDKVAHFIEHHSVPVDLAIDNKGNTMLHYYSKYGNPHICRYLTGRGAIQQRNAQGETPHSLGDKQVKDALKLNGRAEDVLVKWVMRCEKNTRKTMDNKIWGIIQEFHGGNLSMVSRA